VTVDSFGILDSGEAEPPSIASTIWLIVTDDALNSAAT
jgi:hypothetical protein